MDTVIQIISFVLWALSIAIIARSLVSLFDPASRHPISRILVDMTEPIVRPIRQVMPQSGGVDFSPLVALLLIFLLQTILRGVTGG